MSKRWPDLLAIIVLALLVLLVGALPARGSNPVLVAVSLPLLLFVPGYALSTVLIPNRALGMAERLLLSLGLSLAVAVLSGLLLNVLVEDLGSWPWRVWLAGFSILIAAYGIWRREQGASDLGPVVVRLSRRDAALLSAAALLIGLTLGLGATGIDPLSKGTSASTPFTEFWAVPRQSGQQSVIHIGLRNYENERVTYLVTLEAGGRVLAEWPQVTLASGGDWEGQAALPRSFATQEIIANAYRAGETESYRHVRVIPSAERSP